MQSLTERDRKTLKVGGIALAVYLVLFFGLKTAQSLEKKRADYQSLVRQARGMKTSLDPYATKVLLIEKLRGTSGMDPSKMTRATVVALASADIQKAAAAGRIKLGPIRETPGSASIHELAGMQLEATGQVDAIASLLHTLETLGYPLIIDSLELTPDPRKPGEVKLNLDLAILDYEKWSQGKKRKDA